MARDTSSTTKRSKYDIELSDGNKKIGLMLTDARGQNNPIAITRSPYPRTSTKISQGQGKYEDLELPYKSIVQEDWIGGRASLNLEDDTTRFYDSYRAWTEHEKQICLGGQETYCNNYGSSTYRQSQQHTPDSMEFTGMYGDNRILAFKIVGPVNVTKIAILVKKVGTPSYTLDTVWYGDDSGKPGARAMVDSEDLHPEDVDSVAQWRELETPYNISAGQTMWMVLIEQGGPDDEIMPTEDNHWEIATDPAISPAVNSKKASIMGNWTAAEQELCYRVIDDKTYNFKFFEYKSCLYVIDKNNYGTSTLFMNGDRGKSTATTPGYLSDSSKSWTTDEWIGSIVLLISGTGTEQKQPWREIYHNSDTLLTIAPDWDVPPDYTTEYVILGSDKWTYKYSWSGQITDVAVTDEFVYIAMGADNPVVRYREYAGLYDYYMETPVAEQYYAKKLKAIKSPEGWTLWGSLDADPGYGACVWKANVPSCGNTTQSNTSSNLYKQVSILDNGDNLWDDYIENGKAIEVEQTVEGMQLSYPPDVIGEVGRIIPTTDISAGSKLGVWIKANNVSENWGRIYLSDVLPTKRISIADKVWQYQTRVNPTKLVHYSNYGRPTGVTIGVGGTSDTWYPYLENLRDMNFYQYGTITFTSDDEFYISTDSPALLYYFNIVTGNSNSPSYASAYYWNGRAWTAATIYNDGTRTGDTSFHHSGYFVLTEPGDWMPGCDINTTEANPNYEANFLSKDRWHLRIKMSNASSAIKFSEIEYVSRTLTEFPDTERWVSMEGALDISDSASMYTATFRPYDRIFVGNDKKFDSLLVRMGTTVNLVGSYIIVRYWNGYEYNSISLSDNTVGVGPTTLGKTGTIEIAPAEDWERGCASWQSEALGDDLYWLEIIFIPLLSTSYALTTDIDIVGIAVYDRTYDKIYKWRELTNAIDLDSDSNDAFYLNTDEWIYVMHSSKFDKFNPHMDALNSVASTITVQYHTDYGWTTLTHDANGFHDATAIGGIPLASGFGYMYYNIPSDWTPVTIDQDTGYAIRFHADYELYATGYTPLKLGAVYCYRSDALLTFNLGQIQEGFNYIEVDIPHNNYYSPDLSKIVYISFAITGTYADPERVVTIGRVDLISEALDKFKLGSTKINGLESYGDERINPWVFCDDAVYEIQTQNNNAVVPIPLKEISVLHSPINGRAHTVSDIYLVFNIGIHIEKFYQHTLDDVGPDRDEGLPVNRQGDPICMLSYPGRLFLAIDAPYSTILERRSSGWHEIYRAPYENGINDMYIQVIPKKSTRLWVSQGTDILWLPLPANTWNPINDDNFKYFCESTVTTGWINAGFMDISKVWKSIKLYTEDLVADEQYIHCEYQIENGELENSEDWTDITEDFTTSPFQEILLSNAYDIEARRIRFRFKLITKDNEKTPIIKAMIVECLLRFPVKYSYSITYRLEDNPENYTGTKKSSERVEDISSVIDEWSDAPTVLTMRCNFSPFDNKKVVIEPSSLKPIVVDSTDSLTEKHLCQMTLLEV